MTQYVICALQMEGFHCWPEADGELAYLKNSHRHIFFITAGGNGRYRYAKAVELSGRTNAVLTLAPRYENTAMILDMRGLHDACSAPLFQLSLDNDWDETAWSRLRSFLYYC